MQEFKDNANSGFAIQPIDDVDVKSDFFEIRIESRYLDRVTRLVTLVQRQVVDAPSQDGQSTQPVEFKVIYRNFGSGDLGLDDDDENQEREAVGLDL